MNVQGERGADQRTHEHRGDGHEATPRRRPGSPTIGKQVGCHTVDRQRKHGGGQVGDREPARGGVLDPHRDPEKDDQRVLVRAPHRVAARRGDDNRRAEQEHLERGRGREQVPAMTPKTRTDLAAEQSAEHERTQRHERRRDRETPGPAIALIPGTPHSRSCSRRRRDLQQVAERADQARDERQPDQQRRSGPCLAPTTRRRVARTSSKNPTLTSNLISS